MLRRFLIALLVLGASLTFAHPANVPSCLAKVKPDGTLTMRIRFDAIAFATGASPKEADDEAMTALIDGPENVLRETLADAAGRFRRGMMIGNGGEIESLEFPTVMAVRRFLAGDPNPRLPVMLEAIVRARLPKGTRTVAFRYPDTFGVVIQTVEFPYTEPISEPVSPGGTSTTLTIPTDEEVAHLAASMIAPRPAPAAIAKPAPAPLLKPEPIPVPAPDPKPVAVKKETPKPTPPVKAMPPPEKAPEGPPVTSVVAAPTPAGSPIRTYLEMGFTHILPEGLDHILFVVGLFLLGTNTKSLLKQITAFTVAHSITLALATLGVVHLPGRIIEPAIALSIAFVAAENLFIKEVKPRRTAVVFLFGLVHGMGFAEVFADAGLRGQGLVTALLSFNVGVELGQLAVVGIALLAVGWFRKDQRYRKVVVVPASLVIALLAIFWTAERILG